MGQLDQNSKTSPDSKVSLDGERLHRFHDGELSPQERAEVEAALDDTARARLAALSEIGSLLRATSEAEAPPSFDAWPFVQKEIAASKVVSIASARKRRIGLWAGVSTSVAAVAAALALFLWAPGNDAQAAVNGVDVEEIDSESSVTVVDEPGKDGKVAIVWLNDTPGP